MSQSQYVLTVHEIVAKYKSKEHFIEAYKKRGKLLPLGMEFGWNHIKKIISGEKKLIDCVQVKDLSVPPRLKSINVKVFFDKLRHEQNFMDYFPDTCYKKYPPKDYFWSIYSVIKKDEYAQLISAKIRDLKSLKKIKDDKVIITQEALDILKNFNFDNNLSLLSFLISQKGNRCKTGD